MPYQGIVEVKTKTAEAWEVLGWTSRTESWGTAARLLPILQCLPDTERWFPHGKWGTLQALKQQIDENARAEAARYIEEGK